MKYPIFKTKDDITNELLLNTVKEILEHIYKVQSHVKKVEIPLVDDIKIVWGSNV